MRQIPQALADRIENGAATLCHVWLLRRLDGTRMGFTDHDADLTVDGVTCRAASGWVGGAARSGLDAVGSAVVSGGLDDAAIAEVDMAGGLYDQADVELWRVDWEQPDLRARIWRGRLAKCLREGERFTVDIEGPMAALDRIVGRTFGRSCDADLGDARCGVDRAMFPGATCDRRWGTCTSVFNNGAAFRGFPDIPGDDFLMLAPGDGEPNDGRSRR
ncbi:baseplate hub protein [Brevundimonas sp.]|uniref:baseplate hub domain-containing protein n=1 Tax=Brevundimonas sp. TaxID=1871086 RepID=UPI002ED8A21B